MLTLSRYIAAAPRKPLPKRVAEATRHHVLDTLAAMVSGSKLLPGTRAIAYARLFSGSGEATVVGARFLTNPVNAALANGMLAHADETDDAHAASTTHPGCGIVAASLAMAERTRCDGVAFLRAVALGYDVSARLSIALGGSAFRGIGHLTHCFGPTFGSAAAGAALLRLDARQVRHVLSYAAQQASGVATYPRDHDHIEKAFDFGGMPARNGVTAATMVAAGFTAVDDVFSGQRNFFMAYDESGRIGRAPDPSILVRDLGRTYEIVNTDIKRWSVGLPIQAALDSLFELLQKESFSAGEVEEMVVRIPTTGAFITDNREMADICLQHLCALMVVDGGVSFESAHDEKRMRDRRVLALRKRIRLVPDDDLDRLRPNWQGIVDIRLKGGRQRRHHTQAVRGTAQNPMTRDEIEAKALDLMVPILGARRARSLCEAIWNLEQLADLRSLRPLLQV